MALLFKKKESIACTFDDRFIRFFHAAIERDQNVVKTFFSERIPDELFDEHNNLIANPATIKRLETIRKKHGFVKIHVVIPDRYVTVFHTVVPLSIGDEKAPLQKNIEKHLKHLLSEHPEFSAYDMISDYNVINVDDQGIHLHVTVARPEKFKWMIDVLTSAGFDVDHIDISSYAIDRIAKHMDHVDTYGTISIGTHTTNMSIIKSGKIIASTFCNVGSEQLIETLQRVLTISRTEAEKIIHQYGILQSHPDKDVLAELFRTIQPIVANLNQMIVNCSAAKYQHQFYHGAPKEFYMYGVGASINGIAQYLGIKSQTSVKPIDIIPTEFLDEEILLQVPVEVLPVYLPVMSTAVHYLAE